MSILLVVLALACSAPWVVVASRRWGALLAVPAVITAMVLAIILTLLVTPFTPVNLGVVALVELALGAAIGVVAVSRSGAITRRGAVAAAWLWLPATLGAFCWLVVRVLSMVLPDGSSIAWAMSGDTANNLYFARTILGDNGIAIGAESNPVPVVASALAVPLALAHLSPSSTPSLAIDLSVFAWTWSAVIMICCVAMGVVVASLVGPGRTVTRAVTGAIGSLLPLTWFITGLPIDFGYLNAHFALALLLACWLVFLASDRTPAPALTVLVALAILLLLTWTPVVLVPVAFGVVVAVRHRRALLRTRGVALATPLVAAVAFLGLTATLTAPTYFAQADELAAGGHGYPATWILAIVLIGTALLSTAWLRTRLAVPLFPGMSALLLASYAALASTLYVARDLFDQWTAYYPAKLAWLLCALLMPVAASLLVGALTINRGLARSTLAVATATLAVATAACVPLGLPDNYTPLQPADRILTGESWHTGDDAARVIVALADTGGVGLLWDTRSTDEAVINFWAMDAAGGHYKGVTALRAFAFDEYRAYRATGGHSAQSWNELCALLRNRSVSATVYTDNPELQRDLAERCTGSEARFVVGATPGL
ncbi:MAG: hypothetical protein JWM50_1420 [Microbacteriaceae bacterium]|nr:hypothetical protein [Microbacteriaceae bacterium]